MPRIAPLEPPYDEGIARTLDRLMGRTGADPLVLFRTVAHHPELLERFRSTGTYLLNFGTLAPDEREVIILRTCARCGSSYEWGVHVTIYAEAVGLSDDVVAATAADGPVDTDARYGTLMTLVDELHDGTGPSGKPGVSDHTWEKLSTGWSTEQIVEAVVLVGQYHLVSFLTNALELPPEPFGAPMPATTT